MMSTARYVVLAVTTLAVNAAALGNEAPEAAGAEQDVWEIAWSVALYEHLTARRNKPAAWGEWPSEFSRRRDRSDAREVYGDAWAIYKRARAIYEADREKQVVASGENFHFAMQIYVDARMKFEVAIKGESAARSAAANAALAIYETGRERNIAAWENYKAVLQMHDEARMKLKAAHEAEEAALGAVMDAVREGSRAARKAIEKADPSRR